MRDEFEIAERFRAVDFKIELIQHNTKFFLEVLHNQTAGRLEWAIVILLIIEILLCVYEAMQRIRFRELKQSLLGSDCDGDEEDEHFEFET